MLKEHDTVIVGGGQAAGSSIQTRGVRSCKGIYFLGLHGMRTFKSGLLSFVGDDAKYLAQHLPGEV